MGNERGRGGGGIEGTFVGRDAAAGLEAPQTILVLVNGMETVLLVSSSSSSSSRSGESETPPQHVSHFRSPFTSTNLLRLCFPQ